ncbi:MAG: molybdopterin-binding protein, partial [Phormidesmis sp. CAN_BIN44]|nr:molybdopterin-binding protein [Phormidesmis sp. CAN_BIN44]
MPRKDQGWITFQATEEERQLLEEICQQTHRTKTDVLRELVRGLKQPSAVEVHHKSTKAQTASESLTPLPALPIGPKKSLRVSSRNILKGVVKRVVMGAVNSEVTLEIVHQVELVSIITRTSVEELELSEGKEAYAVIKS